MIETREFLTFESSVSFSASRRWSPKKIVRRVKAFSCCLQRRPFRPGYEISILHCDTTSYACVLSLLGEVLAFSFFCLFTLLYDQEYTRRYSNVARAWLQLTLVLRVLHVNIINRMLNIVERRRIRINTNSYFQDIYRSVQVSRIIT